VHLFDEAKLAELIANLQPQPQHKNKQGESIKEFQHTVNDSIPNNDTKLFYLFIEFLKLFLIIDRLTIRPKNGWINMGNEECLAEIRLHMLARATVTMSTGTDLVIERAVDSGID
jgi:hypothetical protein